MPKLQVTSDDPTTVFYVILDGTTCTVARNGRAVWEMWCKGDATRLGAKSLHWTTALRRAIEHIEGE